MRRHLVVANLTLGGQPLLDALRERVSAGPCTIHVVVPAVNDPRLWTSHDNDSDLSAARDRLQEALARFAELGVEVTGEVGDHRPVDAVGDALRQASYDEIIVSTLPPGLSKWLGMDMVRRIERSVDIPVVHVTAKTESV